jgi:hypothetical protein
MALSPSFSKLFSYLSPDMDNIARIYQKQVDITEVQTLSRAVADILASHTATKEDIEAIQSIIRTVYEVAKSALELNSQFKFNNQREMSLVLGFLGQNFIDPLFEKLSNYFGEVETVLVAFRGTLKQLIDSDNLSIDDIGLLQGLWNDLVEKQSPQFSEKEAPDKIDPAAIIATEITSLEDKANYFAEALDPNNKQNQREQFGSRIEAYFDKLRTNKKFDDADIDVLTELMILTGDLCLYEQDEKFTENNYTDALEFLKNSFIKPCFNSALK